MTDDLSKLFTEYLLDGADYTNPTQESAGITLADMQAAIERLRPVMWYAVSPHMPRGQVAKFPENTGTFFSSPECYLFNIDDFDEMRAQLAERFTLRDVREYHPDFRQLLMRMISKPSEFQNYVGY